MRNEVRAAGPDLLSTLDSAVPAPGRPAPLAPASAWTWPAATLAAVVVIAGLAFGALMIRQGIDPCRAVRLTLAIAIPLVVTVFAVSSIGPSARRVCRAFGDVLQGVGRDTGGRS